MHILIVWSWTREHCIAWKLKQSKHDVILSCFWSHVNPWINSLTKNYSVWNITDSQAIVLYAKEVWIELAIIWPEAPLATWVADALWNAKIPAVGPTQELAQLETSKAFTRHLVWKYLPHANPACEYFSSMTWVKEFIETACTNSFVIKNDWLKWGKWVLVMWDHFQTVAEWLAVCEEIIAVWESFLIEEKLIGQEFSLFSFNDWKSIQHSFAIQDNKRAYVWDTWPNTWWMGTISDFDHSLPFLSESDIAQAKEINQYVAQALQTKYPDHPYKWIMYGWFMATANWVKLIEYNARFGDPEVFNLLTLMTSDFLELLLALAHQTLHEYVLTFKHEASVCKYLVPTWYPTNSIKWWEITLGTIPDTVQCFFGSIEDKEWKLQTLGSRAIAVIAHSETIDEAEQKVEQAIPHISGPLEWRKDIWTNKLIENKITMMKELRS